jgi:hypothetical protein
MTQNKFKIKDQELIFDNGCSIVFEFLIRDSEIIVIDDVIIVTLDIPPKIKYNRNVFGVNFDGVVLWQVNFDKTQLFYQCDNCPFVGVSLNKKGLLVLFNWCDTAFIVNPKNGEIIDSYQTK